MPFCTDPQIVSLTMHQLKCPVCKRTVASNREDVIDEYDFPTDQDVFVFAHHNDDNGKLCEASGKRLNPPRQGKKKSRNVFIKFRKP
jgi:hypothetical protein